MKRLARQRSSHFNNNPDNTRTIQTLVEDMIASGSQCNVRGASASPLTPTWARTGGGPLLEPDDEVHFDARCMDLEVDEAFASGRTSDTEREETFLMETVLSLRRAAAPAGVRKVGSLQYRASADAAMSCANVVRNRPRMRKRGNAGKRRRESKASAIVTSPFSSPVVPPSLPDEGASSLCDSSSQDLKTVSL